MVITYKPPPDGELQLCRFGDGSCNGFPFLGQALYAHGIGRFAPHIQALVGPFGVVANQVVVQVGLHLVDTLIPFLSAFDPGVLVRQMRCIRSTRPFD